MRNRKRTGWHRVINGVNISTFFVILFIGLPLYWLIISSFKTPANIGIDPPQYFPDPVSIANYKSAFVQYDFGIYFRNSLIVTLISTAIVLALGTLAGYALGRLPMRGKFTLLVALLMISVFPEIALIAPLYLLLHHLGLLFRDLLLLRSNRFAQLVDLLADVRSVPVCRGTPRRGLAQHHGRYQ